MEHSLSFTRKSVSAKGHRRVKPMEAGADQEATFRTEVVQHAQDAPTAPTKPWQPVSSHLLSSGCISSLLQGDANKSETFPSLWPDFLGERSTKNRKLI